MTSKDDFIPGDRYAGLKTFLADLYERADRDCPFAAPAARRAWIENEITIGLGTIGGVWPMEIYGAVVMAGFEQAEQQQRQ